MKRVHGQLARPSQRSWDCLVGECVKKHNVSPNQAKAMRDALGYGFKFSKVDNDNAIIITASPDCSIQIHGYHGIIAKYAKCSNPIYVPEYKVWAIVVHDDREA